MTIIKKDRVILLYGGLWAANRCEHLLKLLAASGYTIACVFPQYYEKTRHDRNIVSKLVNKITRNVFSYIELFVKASFAEVIYILPGNSNLIHDVLLVSKLFKTKVILELYDSITTHYLDNKGASSIKEEDLDAVKKDNVDLSLSKEKKAIEFSDRIILTTDYEAVFLSQLLGINIPKEKILSAPLCCSPKGLHQRDFMQDGVFRLCWWGSFLPLHGLDYILDAAKILQQSDIAFECDLFGAYAPGSIAHFFEKYTQRIKAEGLNTHVRLRRDLTFADGSLPQYLMHSCDLALGIFGDNLRAKSAVPNKLIESLSMAIPSLTRSSQVLQEFFDIKTDLWTCDPDPESIAQAVLDIYHHKSYPVDWQKTRAKVLETFNIKRYQDVVLQSIEMAIES